MPSIEKMLDFARAHHHKVGYSMAYPARLGPRFMDSAHPLSTIAS